MSDKVAVLERVELVNVGKDDQFEEGEIADRVASVLGYNLLKKSVIQRVGGSKLREVFKELDIRPFSTESVKSYKDSRLKLKGFGKLLDESLCPLTLILTLVSLLATVVSAIVTKVLVLSSLVPILCFYCFLILVFVFLCLLKLLYSSLGEGFKLNMNWEKIAIEKYNKPIPEFALQTALDVKERLPEASFYIEELTIRKVVDPLLVVEHESNVFYLEVWNEPGFDKVRVE